MEIELLSYRLLWCRFLCVRCSLMMMATSFVFMGLFPTAPLLLWNQLLLFSSTLPVAKRPKRRRWRSRRFSFFSDANLKEPSSLWILGGQKKLKILFQYCLFPKHSPSLILRDATFPIECLTFKILFIFEKKTTIRE